MQYLHSAGQRHAFSVCTTTISISGGGERGGGRPTQSAISFHHTRAHHHESTVTAHTITVSHHARTPPLLFSSSRVERNSLWQAHNWPVAPLPAHTSALLSSSGLFPLQAAAVSSPVSHPRHSTSIYVVGVGCETIAPAIEERDGGGKHPCQEAKRSTEQVCACGQNGSATQTQMLVQASPGGCKRS